MSEWVPIIVAGLALIGSIIGGSFVYKANRKGDAESNRLAVRKEEREDRESLIQTYREEVKSYREEANTQNGRIDKLEDGLKKVTRTFRTSLNYIESCLLWERNGSKPPKPPIPESLREFIDPALIIEHRKQQAQNERTDA